MVNCPHRKADASKGTRRTRSTKSTRIITAVPSVVVAFVGFVANSVGSCCLMAIMLISRRESFRHPWPRMVGTLCLPYVSVSLVFVANGTSSLSAWSSISLYTSPWGLAYKAYHGGRVLLSAPTRSPGGVREKQDCVPLEKSVGFDWPRHTPE